LLYDFLDYFEKDGPSFLQREKFLEIVDTIFKDFSKIKREAIVFQVSTFDNNLNCVVLLIRNLQ
jgi:acetylcholinesterase